jgi:hypothetical protein
MDGHRARFEIPFPWPTDVHSYVSAMTATAILDLKQRLSQLSETDRRMASAYLLRLKHESPAGRREATRTMKTMDAGEKIRLKDLAKQLDHPHQLLRKFTRGLAGD